MDQGLPNTGRGDAQHCRATRPASGSGAAREQPAREASVARVSSRRRHRARGGGGSANAFVVELDDASGEFPAAVFLAIAVDVATRLEVLDVAAVAVRYDVIRE